MSEDLKVDTERFFNNFNLLSACIKELNISLNILLILLSVVILGGLILLGGMLDSKDKYDKMIKNLDLKINIVSKNVSDKHKGKISD